MNKHIGHDHSIQNHFTIIGFDEQDQSVRLQYESNEWMRSQNPIRQMGWVEFLEAVMDGRFEIRHPA